MVNKPLIEYFINIEFIPSIIIISIGSSRLYEGHVLYMASFFLLLLYNWWKKSEDWSEHIYSDRSNILDLEALEALEDLEAHDGVQEGLALSKWQFEMSCMKYIMNLDEGRIFQTFRQCKVRFQLISIRFNLNWF